MVCNRCQKRPAIIFVQRMENGQMKNEGFCLHCARELHIKPVEDLMKQFGMSDEDMDNMENRMESMMDEMGDANPLSLMMNMGQPTEGEESEGDDDLVPGSSATCSASRLSMRPPPRSRSTPGRSTRWTDRRSARCRWSRRGDEEKA